MRGSGTWASAAVENLTAAAGKEGVAMIGRNVLYGHPRIEDAVECFCSLSYAYPVQTVWCNEQYGKSVSVQGTDSLSTMKGPYHVCKKEQITDFKAGEFLEELI